MGLNINIRKKYFGRKLIFGNFNYSFPDTGLFILSGPSGRGKTTLLRMIAGLDKDYDGTINGGGATNVSFHFQEYRLFETLTALENITEVSFKEKTQSDIEGAKALLTELGFSDEELQLFPRQLSGGMKMRVSFARAIMKPARILLLDEPTKELDAKTASAVESIILEKSKQSLVIMVTHNNVPSLSSSAAIINI